MDTYLLNRKIDFPQILHGQGHKNDISNMMEKMKSTNAIFNPFYDRDKIDEGL